MKKAFLTLTAATALFAACKKNDSPAPAPVSQRILGTWMMTEDKTVTAVNNIAGAETDNMTGKAACTKDDLYNFLSNGALVQTEGATKCRPQTDPDTVSTGSYALMASDTRLSLKISDSAPVDTFDIVELSGSTLRLKNEITTVSGTTKVVISNRRAYTKK